MIEDAVLEGNTKAEKTTAHSHPVEVASTILKNSTVDIDRMEYPHMSPPAEQCIGGGGGGGGEAFESVVADSSSTTSKDTLLLKKRCFASMMSNSITDNTPPTKLRRLVASCWLYNGNSRNNAVKEQFFKLHQSTSNKNKPNWQQITKWPPSTGSYFYEEQYQEADDGSNEVMVVPPIMSSMTSVEDRCAEHQPTLCTSALPLVPMEASVPRTASKCSGSMDYSSDTTNEKDRMFDHVKEDVMETTESSIMQEDEDEENDEEILEMESFLNSNAAAMECTGQGNKSPPAITPSPDPMKQASGEYGSPSKSTGTSLLMEMSPIRPTEMSPMRPVLDRKAPPSHFQPVSPPTPLRRFTASILKSPPPFITETPQQGVKDFDPSKTPKRAFMWERGSFLLEEITPGFSSEDTIPVIMKPFDMALTPEPKAVRMPPRRIAPKASVRNPMRRDIHFDFARNSPIPSEIVLRANSYDESEDRAHHPLYAPEASGRKASAFAPGQKGKGVKEEEFHVWKA